MRTMQGIFDTVVKRSLNKSKDDRCRYRSGSGDASLPCFAGVLIYDVHYSSRLEGLGVTNRLVSEALANSDVNVDDGDSLSLIVRCQGVHDSWEPGGWEAQLRRVSEEFGLIYKENL